MKITILITGSTDGIGKLAAIKLAKEGHKLYLHGRSQQKLNDAIAEVKRESGNENVDGYLADFSDLSSVSNMIEQIKNDMDSLDVLINNAGVYNSPKLNNDDGFDLRIVVNYFAPYLLTKGLIPLLEHGNTSRIVNLASAAQASIDLEVFSGRIEASERDTYAQSKLALIMWSFHLAKTTKDIAVIAVNPGSLLHTKMALEAFGNSWASADKGADILHDLAVSDDYKGFTEKYFDNDNGNFNQAHPDAYDQTKITKLIETTDDILKKGY